MGIQVSCNNQELVKSTQNQLSASVHQNINQNNIESINFKRNLFYGWCFQNRKRNNVQ